MELIVGGDLVPTKVNIDSFNKGDVKSLLGSELKNIWESSDMRIFNLEVPLTDQEDPIDKQGPNLIAPTSTVRGIKELNPTLITLANNHILDHGAQGLYSTLQLLTQNDISSIVAGENIYEAAKPYIINKYGYRIGVYTCAEHEFTIATENTPGANPFDPLESLDHIQELKSKCDFVLVLYHGGKEHYRYPSPYLQKVCRKIVEKGADLVVCQHSHCVGSFEEYKDSTIVYGQGNFIFNKHDNEFWNNGLLIKISFDKQIKVDYIPFVITGKGIKIPSEKNASKILKGFYRRSEQILENGFIEEQYKKFAQEQIGNYISRFAGFGKWK